MFHCILCRTFTLQLRWDRDLYLYFGIVSVSVPVPHKFCLNKLWLLPWLLDCLHWTSSKPRSKLKCFWFISSVTPALFLVHSKHRTDDVWSDRADSEASVESGGRTERSARQERAAHNLHRVPGDPAASRSRTTVWVCTHTTTHTHTHTHTTTHTHTYTCTHTYTHHTCTHTHTHMISIAGTSCLQPT